MKILYHHRTRATDAQRVHILEMVQAFRGLGHDVTIASLVDPENRAHSPENEAKDAAWKVVLRKIPLAYELVQLAYSLMAIPWLLHRIRRSGAELVYERYALLNFSGVFAARLAGLPVVLEVNAPLALEQTREKETRVGGFASWMERWICNAATKVIVVSGPLRRIMIQNGVQPSRICLLPNGVNLRRFGSASGSRALRESLGIGNRVVIGFVGWFRPWHGLELLVEAFHGSGLANGEAVLLLVGDGPAMPKLKNAAAELGILQSVIFTGPVSHADLPRYADLIDIAVQPAANEYCCPMKILEYMGLGKAIVAPRQENIQELLTEGRTAVLFRPGDAETLSRALIGLAIDSNLRSHLGRKALQTIQDRRLLWEANAERVIEMVRPRRDVMARL